MEGDIIDDYDEEENSFLEEQTSGRNCVVFLIDARKDMFIKRDGNSYFKQSLMCCKNAMLDICRKQRTDLIGVLLYGTKISVGKYSPDNVSVLQELAVPSVSILKKFSEIIENDFKDLQEEYGCVDRACITRAINYCQITINLSKTKIYLKNIVFMTNDDNPCGDDEIAAFRARKQADELYLHHIELDVVSYGENFQSSKFFKELVLTSKGELLKCWEDKDPILKIEQIQKQIEKLTQKNLRRISFVHIGDDESRITLHISLYKIFTEPRKFATLTRYQESPSKKLENKEEIQLTVPKKENMEMDDDDDTDEILNEVMVALEREQQNQEINKVKKEVKNSTEESLATPTNNQTGDEENNKKELVGSVLNPFIGGRFIDISKKDLKERTSPDSMDMIRGFQVIGFVQTVDCPLYLTIGEPYIVLPRTRDKSNRIAFSHLLNKCLERGVSMVGWFCATASSNPSLTFLHPLDKSTCGKGHPQCFLLAKVPFSDEIFEIDEGECEITNNPTEEQLDAAKKIIAKLTLPYKVDMFSDSEYKMRIAMIEALALDYSDLPEIEETTDIDLDEIGEMLGDLNILFTGSSKDDDLDSSVRGTKRNAPVAGNTAAKQRKQFDAIEMIQNGMANKLTVAELRDILKTEGIKSLSSLTKPRLVDIATKRFCSNSQ